MLVVKNLKRAVVNYEEDYEAYVLQEYTKTGYKMIAVLPFKGWLPINEYIDVTTVDPSFNVIKINKCNITVDQNNGKFMVCGNIQLLKE